MKTLGWNCQGLLSRRAVRVLQVILRQLQPNVAFLSETHLNKAKAETLMRKLGFHSMLISESDGRSGGLLLLVKKEVKITQRSVSNQHIDVTVDDGQTWRFTGIYGEPDWNHKDRT